MFDAKRGAKPIDEGSPGDKLYGKIGRLKTKVDWLKKKTGALSREARLGWIEIAHEELPLTPRAGWQACRARRYRRIDAAFWQPCEDESDLTLRALVVEEYTSRPLASASSCLSH